MNRLRSAAYSDDRFDRVNSLASEVLSTELFAMYETYRNTLMAHNVDAALIDSVLSLFLWETCALAGDRVVH